MAYGTSGLPQIQPAGVSAYFEDMPAANKASRALQKKLRVPFEAIGLTLAPGVDPGKVSGEGAYLGITGGGRVLLNVAVPDEATSERVVELITSLGGELANVEHGSPSTGAYGPTTGWGRYGVIGGEPETTSMQPEGESGGGEPAHS
jgi:hypothetical protein